MAGIEGGLTKRRLTSPIIAFRRKQTWTTRFAKHGLHRLSRRRVGLSRKMAATRSGRDTTRASRKRQFRRKMGPMLPPKPRAGMYCAHFDLEHVAITGQPRGPATSHPLGCRRLLISDDTDGSRRPRVHRPTAIDFQWLALRSSRYA